MPPEKIRSEASFAFANATPAFMCVTSAAAAPGARWYGSRYQLASSAAAASEKSPRALYAGETTVDESAWWDDDGEYLGEMPDWREVRRQKAAAAKQEATAEAGDVLSGGVSVDDYFAKGRELGKALAEQARQETAVANPGEISPDDYFGTDNGDMA